jgi:hypothetical protein
VRPESGRMRFCRHIRHRFSGKSGCFLQNQTSFSALFPKNLLSGIFGTAISAVQTGFFSY